MTTKSQYVHTSDLPDFNPLPGYRAKLIHGEAMTVAHWTIDAGCSMPEHSHPHEQMVNAMEGEFELVLDGNPIRMKAGDVLVIPGGVPHSGVAITDCKLIDVWHPVREDYQV